MRFLFKLVGLALFFILLCFYLQAQRVEHSSIFKTIDQVKYIRFHYDNDFFTKTDYYYTQGIVLEFGSPVLKNFIVSTLLPVSKKSNTRYSVGINLASYTPTSISSDDILYGDRPFAATMSFNTTASATNAQKQQRLSTSITLGLIGPAAQGKEIQTGIHRWLKNILPYGWQYQVKNDVVINYDITYEKKLYQIPDHFLLNSTLSASLGTLTDNISGGINFMTGNFNDPYNTKLTGRKKIQYYLFGQARANLIGYDATLQGGIFNRSSPYTLTPGDISRVTFQADAGIIVNFRKTYFSYSQSFLSKEFKTARYHRWGGISFSFVL